MHKRFDLAKALFFAAVAVVIFVYGVVVGTYEVFPHHQILFLEKSVVQVVDEARMLTKTKPTKHLFKARYAGSGVVTRDASRMAPGLTLVASFFDGGLELRLLDAGGAAVNRWPVRLFDLWRNFDHINPPGYDPVTEWNALLNGSVMLPDGSVVFNLRGLVKMDRCGSVVWQVARQTHHSVEPAADGGFWVPAARYVVGRSKHPPVRPPYFEHTILKISAAGTAMREISILDLLIKNGLRAVLFANNREFNSNPEHDVIHLNDVEELSESMAPAFPQFAAGDLLVSLRQANMILVVDPRTEVIKWYQIGPWIQQHDADFQANGKITVFDNHYDGTEDGSVLGGSRVIEVDPVTGASRVLYGGVPDQPMYTAVQGDQQILENGNILITESDSGRVLEVDRQGRVVWQFVNRYSADEVARVPDATRYPKSYFVGESWTCDAPAARN